MSIAFLSRGHGFGHAARDLRVIAALRALEPSVRVDLMSAGSGFDYYRQRSVPCVDLGIPDEAGMSEAATWMVWRHLAKTPSPWDLVVVDEVVSALPFARRILEVPAVALTDWFFADFDAPERDRIFDNAAEVIVLDFPESHPSPPRTSAPVHHAGPVVEDFGVSRSASRAALGLGDRDLTAVLTLGGMADRPEARRMLDCAVASWQRNAAPGQHLFVLGPQPGPDIAPRGGGSITRVGRTAEPAAYFAAADVVLVDAMGFTGCEVAFNHRRVIGFIDAATIGGFPDSFRRRVAHMTERGWLETFGSETDPDVLWRSILRAASDCGARQTRGAADLDDVARRILRHLSSRPERHPVVSAPG